MSGQFPGGYNSPLGGHRGQFNSPQHQQQQMMGQMGPNQMDNSQSAGNPMMPMGGYSNVAGSSGMMPQQSQQGMGGVGQLNPAGIQSPSHMQQPQQQQQPQMMPIQPQMQMQHQQQIPTGTGMGSHMGGIMGQGGGVQSTVGQNTNMVGGHLGQQQQHMSPHHMQQTNIPPLQTSGQHSLPQQQQQAQPQQSQIQQPNITQQPQITQQAPATTTGGGGGGASGGGSAGGNMMTISQTNPPKEINIVQLSRLGQETVQDITSRFQEVFSVLKVIQPTQSRDNNTEKKVQEYFRTIRLLFKRVRIIYEKCNDGYTQGIEYAHVESLIPMKDESDIRNEGTHCEEYKKVLQENQELIETVKLKNRQIREIIDRTRIIIWEINTMLAMRRS